MKKQKSNKVDRVTREYLETARQIYELLEKAGAIKPGMDLRKIFTDNSLKSPVGPNEKFIEFTHNGKEI